MTDITILDGTDVPHPEDRAMIQAMYSRSPAPVRVHLEKMRKVGSGNFMNQYYIGYGHESIGELGEVSIFLEGVSMAAAKAIQDNELYRGQECSTRYIDFSNQPFYCPEEPTTEGMAHRKRHSFMEGWRKLYLKALPLVEDWVRKNYPIDFVLPEDKWHLVSMYDKTVKAITFDTCRGLLPIGATTSVAWSGDLRTIATHCQQLMLHPLAEAKNLAIQLYAKLRDKYPNSFDGQFDIQDFVFVQNCVNTYHTRDQYNFSPRIEITYRYDDDSWTKTDPRFFNRANIKFMPKELRYAAQFSIQDEIDFASYRDLQRHRHGYMAAAIPHHGGAPNHQWYVDRFFKADKELGDEILSYDLKVMKYVNDGNIAYPDHQYMMPMMKLVHTDVHWNLHQTIYVHNLRSNVSVHPTLRANVKRSADIIESMLKLKLFTLDNRKDYQATSRGSQDITEK